MRLGFALWAKTAELTDRVSVTVSDGGWDTIVAAEFPASATIALVSRLDLDLKDRRLGHELAFELVDADSRPIQEIGRRSFSFDKDYDPHHPVHYFHILKLENFPFQNAGDYQCRIFVDSDLLGSVSLYVRQGAPSTPLSQR